MKKQLTLEEARNYLQENPYGKLRALYADPYRYYTRNATIRRSRAGSIIVLNPRSRTFGRPVCWDLVKSVWMETDKEKNQTDKFIRKAKLATFKSDFVQTCLKADPSKSPYENGLSTGVPIEGKIITLKSFGKQYPWIEEQFREALKERRPYRSARVPFRGYEATLELWFTDEAKTLMNGSLSLEYKDCGNGYYYLLVNDDEFIGYDID